VEDIRTALTSVIKDRMTISYLGGGRYRIMVKGTDYKTVEKMLKDASDSIAAYMKKHKAQVEYERVKNIAVDAAS